MISIKSLYVCLLGKLNWRKKFNFFRLVVEQLGVIVNLEDKTFRLCKPCWAFFNYASWAFQQLIQVGCACRTFSWCFTSFRHIISQTAKMLFHTFEIKINTQTRPFICFASEFHNLLPNYLLLFLFLRVLIPRKNISRTENPSISSPAWKTKIKKRLMWMRV